MAMFLPLMSLLGGNEQKETITQTIDAVNSAITDVVNSTSTTSTAKSINVNHFEVDMKPFYVEGYPPIIPSCKNCVFNLGQSIDSKQKVTFNAALENKTTLTNESYDDKAQSSSAIE